jgi:hypothetical protein
MARSCIAAMVTTAKASLISNRSTSPVVQPVAWYSLRIAATGAVVNQPGSCACVAWAMIVASGFRPRRSAVERRISSSAAAPSEIELALAAVTVPSLRNAGFSVGILSGDALAGCSSPAITTSPFLPATVTGAISQANVPSLLAASARDSDTSAKASCASRVKPYLSAHCSANTPISRPLS